MPQPNSAFRIAHLSDLHLTATREESRFEPRWAGGLAGMNDAFRHVAFSEPVQQSDLVLITGDVTDRGQSEAWSIFRDILAEAGLRSRTLAIAGNHDVCGLRSRIGWPSHLAASDLQRARDGLASA